MSELLRPDDTRDALRKLGGLLLGIGVLMLLLRKGEDLGTFGRFIIFAASAVFLYGVGVFTRAETGGLRSWQTVYSVFGLIFVPLTLFAFVDLIDGDTGAPLNVAWIFGVTAVVAGYAAIVAGVRFQLLAGAIAVIIAWSALWDEVLADGISADIGTFRGLLGIIAIILLAAGLYLWRTNPGPDDPAATAIEGTGDRGLWKASELLTGAGIAAVIACSLGISSAANLSPLPVTDFQVIETNWFWDVALLVISLGLVSLGSLIGVRGPVYVGGIGLLLFLGIAGLDLNEDSPDPESLGVWPIVLLVLGGLGVALSAVSEASLGDRPRQFVAKLRGR